MNMRKATDEQKARHEDALRLYESGKTQREIALLYHVSPFTVSKWIARARKQREYDFSLAKMRIKK
jgi:transposase